MTPSDQPSPIDTLVANHRQFLTFLERRVGSREDAEEILQDAFVRGFEHAAEIRNEERVVAWFYRVLRNAIVDRYRRRARDQKGLSEHATQVAAEHEANLDGNLDAELERQVCTCVQGLVPLLNDDYAELIRRVDLDGEAIGAIASERGVSAGSARVRLHRARTALRREVDRTCRTCAEHGCLDCTCRSPDER